MTFLGSHQKAEVVGQIMTLKSGQQANIKSQLKMCLSGTEAAGAINWQEHLNGKFDELFTGQM